MRRSLTIATALALALAPFTSAAQSVNVYGRATTNPPVWQNNAVAPFSFELDGDLRVSAKIVGPSDVNVLTLPPITFNGTQPVSVQNIPSVDVLSMPTTTVTGTVAITGTVLTNVTNTPNVSVTNNPSVNILGTVPITGSVSISGTPNVSVTNTPNVNVLNTVATVSAGGLLNVTDGILPSTTNSQLVATGARALYSVILSSNGTTGGFIRFYNTAVAPTCSASAGSSFPRIWIPPNTTTVINFGGDGITFSNGIGFCITDGNTVNNNVPVLATTTGVISTVYR